VADRIQGFFEIGIAAVIVHKIKMLPKPGRTGVVFPEDVKSGDCKDVYSKGNRSKSSGCSGIECGAGWREIYTFPLVFTNSHPDGQGAMWGCIGCGYDDRTTGKAIGNARTRANIFGGRGRESDGLIAVSVRLERDPGLRWREFWPISSGPG